MCSSGVSQASLQIKHRVVQILHWIRSTKLDTQNRDRIRCVSEPHTKVRMTFYSVCCVLCSSFDFRPKFVWCLRLASSLPLPLPLSPPLLPPLPFCAPFENEEKLYRLSVSYASGRTNSACTSVCECVSVGCSVEQFAERIFFCRSFRHHIHTLMRYEMLIFW